MAQLDTFVDTPLCIGVDLDNTIVSYDLLFHQLALEQDLVPREFPQQKEALRDAIRLRPGGNAVWTRLQALAYGPRMPLATAFPGVIRFFECCQRAGYRMQIVSHKTETASLDGRLVFLRQTALEWLESKGFLSTLGLSKTDIFFESTRQEKVARISALGCTHFIDDLPEVFAEPHFPRQTQRFLFSPHPRGEPPIGLRVAESWEDLVRHFFENGI